MAIIHACLGMRRILTGLRITPNVFFALILAGYIFFPSPHDT